MEEEEDVSIPASKMWELFILLIFLLMSQHSQESGPAQMDTRKPGLLLAGSEAFRRVWEPGAICDLTLTLCLLRNAGPMHISERAFWVSGKGMGPGGRQWSLR